MRNPLNRSTAPSPSFRERLAGYRERLAAARAKAGQVVAVNRLLLAPPPAPEPAVDRAALVNYATFLDLERRSVCAELYPHMGWRATQFVLSMNAAWCFFKAGENNPRPRTDIAPASTRAVKVLDLVGIDWRKDSSDDDIGMRYGSSLVDTGARPALPHNWPTPDAALLEALDDLTRLDAAQRAIHTAGDPARDGDEVPGYADLETARDAAINRLAVTRAESLTGLQAKARALLTHSVEGGGGAPFASIASSLARDLLGLGAAAVEPQPDPVFAAIAEARRLMREHDRLHDVAGRLPGTDPAWEPESEAYAAMWDHIDDTLLKTVPRTAEGCKALARFGSDFAKAQGVPLLRNFDHGQPDPILALIAHSPLL